MGADVAVTDSVAEAMALASRGVSVSALTYLDARPGGGNLGRRSSPCGRPPVSPWRPSRGSQACRPVTERDSENGVKGC